MARSLTKILLIALSVALASSLSVEYFLFSHEISALEQKLKIRQDEIKAYEKIIQEINSRTPLAEENLTKLIQITPKIRNISLSLYTGNPLQDLKKYTRWVHEHIRYNYDSEYPYVIAGKVYFKPDVWAPSSLTLKRGYGDCEDMAILAASLFLAAHPNFDVYIIVISLGNVSHAAVFVPALRAVADPTYGGVFTGSNFLFLWFKAISAPQNAYVRFIVGFKGGKPYYMLFSSNSSFLNWVKEEYGV